MDRLFRTAQWRKSPASDAQKAFLIKRLLGRQIAEDSPESKSQATRERIASMMKGEAADFITRLKHGAKVCPSTHRV
jgi:ATP-dependent helicase IRC3